jgi:glycerol dehydrogenase
MIISTYFPSRYLQGANIINQFFDFTGIYGKNPLFLCSPYIYNNIIPELKKSQILFQNINYIKFSGECTFNEIGRVFELCKSGNNDFVVGFGGGKVLDTARAVADKINCPVVVIPSIASTDAPTASVSVIYSEQGEVIDVLTFPSNPNLVLVDTRIIANAPVRFLVSGMGDALATWIEAEACKNHNIKNITGFYGSLTAYGIAKLCYETILEYGLAAKLSNEAKVVTPALEHIVEANTLMSGIGFESGGLAASHSIHNGLTVLPAAHSYFHGEKVAFGMLASLFLTDKPQCIIDELYTFCKDIGLPTTLQEIGLDGCSDSDLMKVAVRACQSGEFIYNDLSIVTPEMVFASLKIADAEGRRRKR